MAVGVFPDLDELIWRHFIFSIFTLTRGGLAGGENFIRFFYYFLRNGWLDKAFG